jgi:ribosomal protein S18 acetylase RimI-like enzyme
MIRDTIAADTDALFAILAESGQFDGGGVEYVADVLRRHLGEGSDAIWMTADDGEPIAFAYCGPEPVASGVWNLWMLWTRRDRVGRGHGADLVETIERRLTDISTRRLIVETSSLDAFAPARAFYRKCGFEHEATVRDFFADGDDKLIYTKTLSK